MNVLLHDGDVRPLSNVIWNLFLAVIPVVAAFLLARTVRGNLAAGRRPITLIVLLELLVWAGFLPNTCYLLTEWRHYIVNIAIGDFYPAVRSSHDAVVRLLVSTAFYIAYSGSGLLAFFLAIWPLDKLVRERAPSRATALTVLIFALCALGVYLGLIHRYNTWDLVNPSTLPSVLHTVATVFTRRFVTVLMVGFTGVLWLLYFGFDIWMDGLTLRLKARRPRDTGGTVSTSK